MVLVKSLSRYLPMMVSARPGHWLPGLRFYAPYSDNVFSHNKYSLPWNIPTKRADRCTMLYISSKKQPVYVS